MESVENSNAVEKIQVPVGELTDFVRAVAVRCELPAVHADLLAESLVAADLRGVPSHGVFRLAIYARGYLSGHINPAPRLTESGDRSAARLIDGDNGLGLIVGQLAMDRAIELAREHGVGLVSVRNSNHSGVLAVHALRAAREGMIGYFTSNAPALMAPWGAQDPLLSNSPFAYAFPARDTPVVVDMACSAVARGRIRMAAVDGLPIPFGWALDAEGSPTDDAVAAMDGVVLPMGDHKGSGLAVAHEILATCLSGANLSMDVPKAFLRHGADTLDSWGVGHLAMAIDVGATRQLDDFREDVGRLSDAVRSLTPRPDFAKVLMPGDPEEESTRVLRLHGIPLSSESCRSLERLARELGIEAPAAIGAGPGKS